MLVEDTRQSLAIEGYFATKDDLVAALGGGKTDLEIATISAPHRQSTIRRYNTAATK
jgi:hypothetical protein